jgi:hypothetical protein
MHLMQIRANINVSINGVRNKYDQKTSSVTGPDKIEVKLWTAKQYSD